MNAPAKLCVQALAPPNQIISWCNALRSCFLTLGSATKSSKGQPHQQGPADSGERLQPSALGAPAAPGQSLGGKAEYSDKSFSFATPPDTSEHAGMCDVRVHAHTSAAKPLRSDKTDLSTLMPTLHDPPWFRRMQEKCALLVLCVIGSWCLCSLCLHQKFVVSHRFQVCIRVVRV